jgi:hypothetical protein
MTPSYSTVSAYAPAAKKRHKAASRGCQKWDGVKIPPDLPLEKGGDGMVPLERGGGGTFPLERGGIEGRNEVTPLWVMGGEGGFFWALRARFNDVLWFRILMGVLPPSQG